MMSDPPHSSALHHYLSQILQGKPLPPPPPNAPAPPTDADTGTVLEVASKEELFKAVSTSRGDLGIGPEHFVVTAHLDLSIPAIGERSGFLYDNARSVRVRKLVEAMLCTFVCLVCFTYCQCGLTCLSSGSCLGVQAELQARMQ
jgi:hypothetical protein